MIFWRIVDNQLHPVQETDHLGFEKSEGLRIPDEYLDKQEFMVMRTAHGIGDWGIISAMPRLLKEKYSDCKVYVPSEKLLNSLFGQIQTNWTAWSNPLSNAKKIFDNNPFIDEFVDEIDGEVFHDHYRIYDNDNIDVPLVEQMLKFWQFEEDEYQDSQPELYFSEEEIEMGNKIIGEHTNGDFGTLLISNRYDYSNDNLINDVLMENRLPYFYYSPVPLEQTSFKFIDKALDMKHIDIRLQLYIHSKAKLNIGNQSGAIQLGVRKSKIYNIQRQFPMAGNFVRGENYLKDDFKRSLLKGSIRKSESKTTTSMKFKADTIDFFRNDFKDKIVVEIGTSLGYGTKILSGLFKKVITLDNSNDKLHEAKENLKDFDNIEFKLMDVYNQIWQFEENVDAVFIDCVHDYDHVKSDVDNSIMTFDKPIIMFDDYGLFPEVKRLIDEYILDGKLKVLEKIGHYKGKVYPKTQNKVLIDREGIICQTL